MLKPLADVLAALRGIAEGPRTGPDDVTLAAAALVVRLAMVDGAFSSREAAWLRRTVEQVTGLTGAEADRFIARADRYDRETGDLSTTLDVLRRHLDPDRRLTLLAHLWRMAMADGVLHEFEEDLIGRIADQLGISPLEAEAIRAAEVDKE